MCWYQWWMPWIQILRYCRFLMILSIDWSECAAVCAECQILWYCRYINILSIDWSECAAVCAECPGLRWSDPGSPHHKIHQVNLSVEEKTGNFNFKRTQKNLQQQFFFLIHTSHAFGYTSELFNSIIPFRFHTFSQRWQNWLTLF